MELYITIFMAHPGDSARKRFSEKYAKLFFLSCGYALALGATNYFRGTI
jgi:hypothetical protein